MAMKRLPLVVFCLLAAAAMADDASKVTVYYLHNTWRCYSCNSIESLTRAAVLGGKGENTKFKGEIDATSPFPEMVKAGTLSFEPVNVDLAENKHLLTDLKAEAKYPVMVETKGGKVVRSKVLTEVWERLGDNAGFIKYVQTELRAFVGGDKK
jgi:hypothetical protein